MTQKNPSLKELSPNVKQIIETLKTGNGRFVIGMRVSNITDTRRQELLAGQHPQVSLLCCSDSRVPPELIFDRGLGEIFVVRTAGNVVDDIALGSLEYGAEHLVTPLLLVLGHTRCGAVTAAYQSPDMPGHLKKIMEEIKPAIELSSTSVRGKKEDLVSVAIKQNVNRMVKIIPERSEILQHLIGKGKLVIIGAVYHMETGEVEFLR
ncbi:MAG: carbonic anhydrase [Promethearchaeota archaeon CR_4]|nr:MAG: carbonic anhydrase [Candidatus Lokiarchaeota archaeon CR_4]